MKNILLKLLENISAPRIPHTLKSSPGMMDWLKDQTQIYNPKNSSEMVYIVLNGPTPLCACGNRRKFNTFNLGYRVCCDRGLKCISSIDAKMSGLRKNLMETYGVTNANDVPGVAEKRKATMIQNHGVEYAAQSTAVQEKMSQTMQSKSIEEKDLILAKTRASMVEKFGVSHHMKLDEQKQKVIDTNLARYGVEHPLQNDVILTSMKNTYASKSMDDIQAIANKTKKTYQEKYGVDFASHIGMQSWVIKILSDKDTFINFINNKTRLEVIDALSIHPHCLYLYSKKYNASEFFAKQLRSKFEYDIGDMLDALGIVYFIGDRTILAPKELDFYIPSLNIAIECCGLYWHSEMSSSRGKTYHYDKHAICKRNGIKLITIFEDEWMTKRSQVTTRLAHILGKSDSKISARKCDFKLVDSKLAHQFIEQYHIQGNAPASIYFGLYQTDILVAVMSFSKSRYNSNYEYELVRFCAAGNIIGGASKLFKNFIRLYNPTSIISYSDNRWGWGSLYDTLGFQFNAIEIGYHYTNYKRRFNRLNFQKHKLVEQGHDPSLTEWEIMQNLGYDRIWDCGQASWTWINNTIILE